MQSSPSRALPDPLSGSAPSAWMWAEDGNVYGLSIDLETRTLRWFANAGCLCDHDDSTVDQTPTDFLARGVPGAVAEPPDGVLAEIAEAARRIVPGRHDLPVSD